MSTTTNANGAASFWAKNVSTVKTATTPNPTFTEPPKPKEAAAAKKGLVLKGGSAAKGRMAVNDRNTGMANGNTTPRKTDWADSDDDEEFFTNLKGGKNRRITVLEGAVAQKDAEIEALHAIVGSKDARIQQLEEVIVEKDLQVGDLEADKEEKAAVIEQQKEDNHKQYLYVQELVAEVDEKNRRVLDLEAELDVKGGRISELESQAKPAVPTSVSSKLSPPPTPRSEPVAEQAATPTKVAEPAKVAEQTPVKKAPEPAPGHAVKDSSLSKDAEGPAINESKFPTLWSPDKPKKVVAPVERPKTLVMAIDTSKYGRKAVAPIVFPKKSGPSSDNGRQVVYGQCTKNRVKSDVVPPFAPDQDIRKVPHAQRVLYANGPDVTVFMGDKKLMTLSKYVLMQCSGKAYTHFKDVTATSIVFPADSMDADSAIAHLNWMVEMTYQGRVYSVTLNGDEKHDLKNLKICQAARVMGLNNTYVGHFTKVLCDRIRSNTASPEFLTAICEHAYLANDPIFECLANNLVNQQGKQAFARAEDFEELLAKFPLLKEKMDKIEVRIKNSRAADKRKGGASRDASKHRDGRKDVQGPEKKLAVVREG